MVGNYEVLKNKFESLPPNVIVIGSHTMLDNRKEKVLSHYCILSSITFSGYLDYGNVFAALSNCCMVMLPDPTWWPSIYQVWEQSDSTTRSCLPGKESLPLHFLP